LEEDEWNAKLNFELENDDSVWGEGWGEVRVSSWTIFIFQVKEENEDQWRDRIAKDAKKKFETDSNNYSKFQRNSAQSISNMIFNDFRTCSR
jgi:hypothetical protein